MKKWENKEYSVFEFKKIKSHCMFVQIEQIFKDQFIVDLEI